MRSIMGVHVDFSALFKTHWHECAVRFGFGSAVTVFAGVIAHLWGPGAAGLFLAFPAIFPAAATLVEKHEKSSRQKGKHNALKAKYAAALDARGAAFGSIGLLVFALTVWQLVGIWGGLASVACGLLAWLLTSVSVWYAFKKRRLLFRRLFSAHVDGGAPSERRRRKEPLISSR